MASFLSLAAIDFVAAANDTHNARNASSMGFGALLARLVLAGPASARNTLVLLVHVYDGDSDVVYGAPLLHKAGDLHISYSERPGFDSPRLNLRCTSRFLFQTLKLIATPLIQEEM